MLFLVSPTHHLKLRTDTGDQGKVGKTHRSLGSVLDGRGPEVLFGLACS